MHFINLLVFYIKRMFGLLKDQSGNKKQSVNDIDEDEILKIKHPSFNTKKFLKEASSKREHSLASKSILQSEAQNCSIKKGQESLALTSSDKAKEELVSVFVKTSQHLQEMVRSYETKVNQTTEYISCLQNHIALLHDQLAHKNKLIGRMCDRYISLCKEKQTSEEHLQSKVDELSGVVESCLNNDTPQLQRLLIHQVNRNRHLEYQNESLAQHVTKLCSNKNRLL